MLVSPPRERPRLSLLGLPADFLSFDPAPCGEGGGCDDLRVDVGRWLVAGTGSMLMGADYPRVHCDGPLQALLLVGVAAQLVQDTSPRAIT